MTQQNWKSLRTAAGMALIACFVATILLPARWGTLLMSGCVAAVLVLFVADSRIDQRRPSTSSEGDLDYLDDGGHGDSDSDGGSDD